MVSRRNFLLAGGAGMSAGAVWLAMGESPLAMADGRAVVTEGAAGELLAPAPTAFVALADTLSGHIGVDRQLVNRIYHVLSGVVQGLDTTTAQLVDGLVHLQALPPPQRLAGMDAASRELFRRMTSALYNGTIDVDASTRECVGFETLASHDLTADYVRPPSYCVGSPNFWIAPPVLANRHQEPAHV